MKHLDHPPPPPPPKSRMENGAFFPSRDFIIDFSGVGGFLFHVIPTEIVDNSRLKWYALTDILRSV